MRTTQVTKECRDFWVDVALGSLKDGDTAAKILQDMQADLTDLKKEVKENRQDATPEYNTDAKNLKTFLREAIKQHAAAEAEDWRKHFESAGEVDCHPPVWLVEDWLMKGTTMALSGLPESYKTFVALNLCRALLTGEPLFGRLKVNEQSDILYLIPEMSRAMFFARQKVMRVGQFQERFLFQTLERPKRELSDPVLLAACKGRTVIIDTARRYLTGQNAQDAADFSAQCYGLLGAGAKAVVILFHSGKPGRYQKDVTLQNSIADSVEHGAQVATSHALKVENREQGLIRVTNTKNSHRADGHAPPFYLRAIPDLNERGEFGYESTPAQKKQGKADEVTKLLKAGKSTAEIQQITGASKNTISRRRQKLKLIQ